MHIVVRGKVLHARGNLYGNVGHVRVLEHPVRYAVTAHGYVRLGRVHDEKLVQVSLRHVLKDEALGLILVDDPKEADNVGVPQVGHQLRLPVKVLPHLLVGAWLQGLDSHHRGDAAHDAP